MTNTRGNDNIEYWAEVDASHRQEYDQQMHDSWAAASVSIMDDDESTTDISESLKPNQHDDVPTMYTISTWQVVTVGIITGCSIIWMGF